MRVSRALIRHQPHHGWLSLILPPPLPPSPPQITANHTRAPACEPLPSIEGCGLLQYHIGSLRSEVAASAAPPLSKGMWAWRRGKGGGGWRGNEAGKEGKTRWWRRGTWSGKGEGNHDGWRTKLGKPNPTTTNSGEFHPKPTRAGPTQARPTQRQRIQTNHTQRWPTPANPPQWWWIPLPKTNASEPHPTTTTSQSHPITATGWPPPRWWARRQGGQAGGARPAGRGKMTRSRRGKTTRSQRGDITMTRRRVSATRPNATRQWRSANQPNVMMRRRVTQPPRWAGRRPVRSNPTHRGGGRQVQPNPTRRRQVRASPTWWGGRQFNPPQPSWWAGRGPVRPSPTWRGEGGCLNPPRGGGPVQPNVDIDECASWVQGGQESRATWFCSHFFFIVPRT